MGPIEIPLGFVQVQLSGTQLLSLFWAATLSGSFNIAYFLSLWERKTVPVARARIAMTVLIGTLLILGTYVEALGSKVFAWSDCTFLALVAAHGWTAEQFVARFVKNAMERQHVA
jgi:hypothetical protein